MAQIRPAWLFGAAWVAWVAAAFAVARASAKVVPRSVWRCSPTLATHCAVRAAMRAK